MCKIKHKAKKKKNTDSEVWSCAQNITQINQKVQLACLHKILSGAHNQTLSIKMLCMFSRIWSKSGESSMLFERQIRYSYSVLNNNLLKKKKKRLKAEASQCLNSAVGQTVWVNRVKAQMTEGLLLWRTSKRGDFSGRMCGGERSNLQTWSLSDGGWRKGGPEWGMKGLWISTGRNWSEGLWHKDQPPLNKRMSYIRQKDLNVQLFSSTFTSILFHWVYRSSSLLSCIIIYGLCSCFKCVFSFPHELLRVCPSL